MPGVTKLSSLSSGPSLILGAVIILLIGALIAFLTIARAGRYDADPSGRRPMTAYLLSGAFATLWTAYIGAIGIASGFIGFIGKHTTYAMPVAFGGPKHPVGDANVRTITEGLLLVVIAGVASLLHRSRGLQIAADDDDANSPAKKVARTYAATVSFFAVAVFIVAALLGAYQLFQLIAPGIYGGATRLGTFRDLLLIGTILVTITVTFRSHQHIAPSELRLFSMGSGGHDHDHDHEGHDHDHGAASLPE